MAERIKVGKAVLEFEVDDKGVVTGLKRIKDDVKNTSQSWTSEWAKMASAVAGGQLLDRAISGVISFGKEALESAGHIVDLAEQTGLSITKVQQFGYVAEQTGSSLESWANATFKLGTNVEKGGKEIESALSAIGLSISQVRQLKPEDQIDEVAKALEQVTDVQQRNTLGVALMGKGYKDISAGIADYTRLMGEANVTTEDSVQALSDAGDAWDAFLSSVGAKSRDVLGQLVIDGKNAVSGWSKFFGDIKATASGLFDGGLAGAKDAHNDYINSLNLQQQATDKNTVADGKAAAAAREKAAAHEREQKAIDAAKKSQEAYNKEVEQLLGTLRGDDLAKKVKVLQDAYNRLTKEQLEDEKVMARVTAETLKLADAGAKLPPKLDDIARKAQSARAALEIAKLTVTDFGKAIENLGTKIDLADPKFYKFGSMLDGAQKDTEEVIGAIKNLGTEVTLLPPPPVEGWSFFKDYATGVIYDVSHAMAVGLTDMITGQLGFKDSMREIWGGIKQILLSILDDILAYFIRSFLAGMLKGILGANLGGALGTAIGGGVAGAVGGGVAGAVGGGAGAAAGGGVAGGVAGGVGLGTVGAFVGGAVAPYLIGQFLNPSSGLYTPDPTLLEQAQAIADYAGIGSYALNEFLNEHPELNGQGNGFRWGTPDLDYESFRASGEPRMLHGREAVIPRGSGHQLAAEIAAALGPMLDRGGDVTLVMDNEVVGRIVGRTRATHEELSRGISLNAFGLGTAVRQAV